MSDGLLATLTGTTCGEACWSAREDVCRCSCGGANHGVLRSAQGIQPRRTCRIKGHAYELVATGTYPDIEQAKRDLEGLCVKRGLGDNRYGYHTLGFDTDPGYPVLRRAAHEHGIARWPELQGSETATPADTHNVAGGAGQPVGNPATRFQSEGGVTQ